MITIMIWFIRVWSFKWHQAWLYLTPFWHWRYLMLLVNVWPCWEMKVQQPYSKPSKTHALRISISIQNPTHIISSNHHIIRSYQIKIMGEQTQWLIVIQYPSLQKWAWSSAPKTNQTTWWQVALTPLQVPPLGSAQVSTFKLSSLGSRPFSRKYASWL